MNEAGAETAIGSNLTLRFLLIGSRSSRKLGAAMRHGQHYTGPAAEGMQSNIGADTEYAFQRILAQHLLWKSCGRNTAILHQNDAAGIERREIERPLPMFQIKRRGRLVEEQKRAGSFPYLRQHPR